MMRVVWVTLLSTCLLVIAVDSVVIRDWRHKAKMNNVTSSTLSGHHAGLGGGGSGKFGPAAGKTRKGFRATHSRCCKIGEKVAKRKLSCDVQVLEKVRTFHDKQRAKFKYNRPRKMVPSAISVKLSNKLRKCSVSFPKYFEKCCKYREQFFQSIAKCKKRQGKERRKCRQSVRRRYKSPNAASSSTPSRGGRKARKSRRKNPTGR